MAATREDATLIVELAKWGAMTGLPEASREVFAEDFDREGAHVLDPAAHTVLVFHETVGVFVKNGLLDRDLVHDWIWVSGAWERLAPAALAARERAGIPEIFENFEALAQGQS